MSDILACFSSCYSGPGSSLLTLEDAGKGKEGCASSVFDCVKEAGLKEVVLVEDRIDGYIAAFKAAEKAKVKLCFGLKLTVCADISQKDDASLSTESKVIVFARNGEPNEQGLPKGYSELVKLWSRAANQGFFYQPRADWGLLKVLWSDNLLLALPWASSFIARNTLTFNRIVPALPTPTPWVFREVGSGLPFAPLIDAAIDRYVKEADGVVKPIVQDVKSVYYRSAQDFKAYMVMKAIANRSTFDKPNVNHLSSAEFSFESWCELTASKPQPSLP